MKVRWRMSTNEKSLFAGTRMTKEYRSSRRLARTREGLKASSGPAVGPNDAVSKGRDSWYQRRRRIRCMDLDDDDDDDIPQYKSGLKSRDKNGKGYSSDRLKSRLSNNNYGGEHANSWMRIGAQLDVLDIYVSSKTRKETRKWRPATIIRVSRPRSVPILKGGKTSTTFGWTYRMRASRGAARGAYGRTSKGCESQCRGARAGRHSARIGKLSWRRGV